MRFFQKGGRVADNFCYPLFFMKQYKFAQQIAITEEYFRENVFVTLMNQERRSWYVKRLPHTDFLDLALIFCVELRPFGKDYIEDTFVTYDMLETLDISLQEVQELSSINTPKLFPPYRKEIKEAVETLAFKFGSGIYELLNDHMHEEPITFISNKKFQYGAHCMLNKDIMGEISKKYGEDDLYIIPRSVNDLIVTPVSYVSMDKAVEYIAEQNDFFTPDEEVLSYSIYQFCYKTGEVRYAF